MKAILYGVEISEQEIEDGRINFYTLSEAIDNCGGRILCNSIVDVANKLDDYSFWENWENYGTPVDQDGNECDEDGEEFDGFSYPDIYQYFLVADNCDTRSILAEAEQPYTYFEPLDCLVWAVTHFGTPWSGVSTCVEISASTKGMQIY